MSWTTAVTDLRATLHDGDTDKLRYRKRVIGNLNGTNLVFKTFEYRRITNLATTTNMRLGVFIDGVRATVESDDPELGEFTLQSLTATPDTGPANTVTLEASYYIQWFTDDELNEFLENASEWLGYGQVFDNLDTGLRPAAMDYAAYDAYRKLAARYSEQMSETFRFEDAPEDKRNTPMDAWNRMANDRLKSAMMKRDDYYKRQGQPLAPRWGSAQGTVRNMEPAD